MANRQSFDYKLLFSLIQIARNQNRVLLFCASFWWRLNVIRLAVKKFSTRFNVHSMAWEKMLTKMVNFSYFIWEKKNANNEDLISASKTNHGLLWVRFIFIFPKKVYLTWRLFSTWLCFAKEAIRCNWNWNWKWCAWKGKSKQTQCHSFVFICVSRHNCEK